MPERLKGRFERVAGVRQVLRAMAQGRLESVFLALDAAPHLRAQVEQAAKEADIPLEMIATMEELGQLCRVDVPAAAAGKLKEAAKNPG